MRHKVVTRSDSDKMEKEYPAMHEYFNTVLRICNDFINENTDIVCEYKTEGRNFLVNHNGVVRQHIHTDYGYYT